MTSIHIGVVMGSSSDWDTMQHAVEILQHFGIAHEARVVSAHRMPDDLFAYAEGAAGRGLKAIIAGAGGAAHLPGMLAAKTPVPVLGVPVASRHLQGVDSLYSIVQMPKGIPVATFAIGTAGAANAALFAVALLANENAELRTRLFKNAELFRRRMAEEGFELLPGEHAIVPVMFGDAAEAARVADEMLDHGVFVTAFSFPVVPRGAARIRVQLSASHSPDDVEAAVQAFVAARG